MAPQIPESMLLEMLARAAAWVEAQERHILEHGQSLSAQGIEIARRAGVRYPERVRLLPVSAIPLPEEEDLKQAALTFGLLTDGTEGLTLGYGIYLLQRLETNPNADSLVAHELVHVSQYESCGGVLGFLQKYLFEVNTYGYPAAPMEQQAIAFERSFRQHE